MEIVRNSGNKIDLVYLCLLVLVIVGLPLGLHLYDRLVWQKTIAPGAKEFTLTGHAQKGWFKGEIHAYNAVTLWPDNQKIERPIIEVTRGDLVVLKLKSSDVIHGFSLKDFAVFITDGIQPGKVTLVSFRADKIGTFTFSCNAICGDNHQNMQGTLVVKA
ncbi:hypothetical protein ACFL9T_06465 [Thermodesulfobacteriota bacterium]